MNGTAEYFSSPMGAMTLRALSRQSSPVSIFEMAAKTGVTMLGMHYRGEIFVHPRVERFTYTTLAGTSANYSVDQVFAHEFGHAVHGFGISAAEEQRTVDEWENMYHEFKGTPLRGPY